MDKVTRQCPQTTTFLKRKESRSGIKPRSFRLPAYRLTARPNRLTKTMIKSLVVAVVCTLSLSLSLSPARAATVRTKSVSHQSSDTARRFPVFDKSEGIPDAQLRVGPNWHCRKSVTSGPGRWKRGGGGRFPRLRQGTILAAVCAIHS